MQTLVETSTAPPLSPGDARGSRTGRITLNSSAMNSKKASKRADREGHLRLNRTYHREPYPSSPNADVNVLLVKPNVELSPLPSPNSQPVPSRSSMSYCQRINGSQTYWLCLYFCFNLGLTLYNKGVLVYFPFPYTLTAVHALFGSLGSSALARAGFFKPAQLTKSQRMVVTAFSVLYAINIVVSNVSLQLVTVPFHQVVRAVTPLFTIILSSLLLGTTSSRARIISLIPVVAGVGFATYGDYYYTKWGFFLTLLGAVLAALKTILTNVLQSPPASSGSSSPLAKHFNLRSSSPALPKLNPLAFLHLLSPLAFVQCIIFAQLSGELTRIRHYAGTEMSSGKLLAVAFNGCIAFGLNVVSFSANKKVGPLSMTVAANVKQVLTILLAVLIFNLTISTTNVLGILLTLLGGAWYARVEYTEKKRAKERRLRAI
ncbi:hypothetical protein VNI00_004373 [Paramarasmius palmivorus]|uniref:Sugar phosphate transporter domain-containing protein n=1 Tax=Paramarasmius palmivorus TaxID=297713 RepID=A0AAW0DRG8_9AGAR